MEVSGDGSLGPEGEQRPQVLIVDDQPAEQQSLVDILVGRGISAAAVHPGSLTSGLVSDALVFLVDEYLEHWEGRREGVSLAQLPQDGLAVAAVIRSLRREANRRAVIAIRTGMLEQLGEHLPAGQRDSLLAAQHDLEWVFNKADVPGEPPNVNRLIALTEAARSLPTEWRADTGFDWLGLDGSESWHLAGRRSVDEARPPAHAVATHTGGQSYLRWLLQRILPFPTFLVSDIYAAARMGLPVSELVRVLDSKSPLAERLSRAIYSGPLRGFTNRRWWRAAIDELLDDLSVSGLAPLDMAEALSTLHGDALEPLPLDHPVVVIDADYRVIPDPIEAEEAIRLAPDGWPVFADDPWAPLEDVADDPQLRIVVAQIDQPRLDLLV